MLLQKVKQYLYLLFIIFFSTLSFHSCQSPHFNLSVDERIWMEKFFRDFMLEEGAVFTLLGSKPMTRIILYEYSQERVAQYYRSLTEEDIKNARIIEKYDLPENWDKWKNLQHRFPSKRFILAETPWQKDKEVRFVYFVDTIKTAMVIQDHYEEFKLAYGDDFNPLEKVLEITEPDTTFWKKISKNYVLWGLLFGYGKENAYFFHWKYEHPTETVSHFLDSLGKVSKTDKLLGAGKRSLKNLEVPAFISFRRDDPMIEKYEKEKEKIQKYYAKRNFLDATLARYME